MDYTAESMDKNSKIGILGAGVEGLAAAEYLAGHGYSDVTVFDAGEKVEGAIPEGVKMKTGDDFMAGRDAGVGSVYDCDVLFRSPGIHFERLKKAREKGIKVTSTTQFFFENCPGKIIGVTGTKGKGTTSTLIYEILKKHGVDVYLGGNIGRSPLTFLDEMDEKSVAVMELSSFQLQDMTLSPQAAVVLMTTTDHMDYHADRAEYWEAKKPIALYQGPDDFCVLNRDYKYCEEFMTAGKGKKLLVSRREPMHGEIENGAFIKRGKIIYAHESAATEIGETERVGLLGEHNLENVMAAVCVAARMKVPTPTIRKAVYEFKGLEHRLEFVKEVKGVRFYNDSFSTTPETSIAAAYAFKGPVMLIAGGSEKNSDYTEWGTELQKNKNLKSVFLIGLMADRMEKALNEAHTRLAKEAGPEDAAQFAVNIYRCGSLEEAVKTAYETGVQGDNVVMSPAAASFDMFKNYKERGKAFREIVGKL